MSSKNRIRFLKTISFKITLWYLLSVMGILLFSGTFLYFRLQHKLDKKADQLILDEEEELLLTLLDKDSTLNDLKSAIALEFSEDRYYKLSIRLLDAGGKTIIVSDNFSVQDLETSEIAVTKAKGGESVFQSVRVRERKYPFRLLTKAIDQDGSLKYILQIGLYMKPLYKTIENLKSNLLILIPILIVLSITGGWFLARRSLSPIENITRTTQKITASNLNKRLVPTHTGDEVDELANTINLMLGRIEDSFVRIAQFTSDVSHELRTPVAALKTGTEVILSKERTAEEYRDLLENNLSTLERMTRMISDLLELSRSDSGTSILHLKSFSLGNFLNELQNKFRLISETKNINILNNELPDIQIEGDKDLLRRVFSNLLDNAIKFTSHGGSISITLADRGNDVVTCIKDTGIGISEEHLEKVFDRFFRVDSSRSRDTGGTGLGLNICKNIVELHKGKIQVKSKTAAGSTFEVVLPKSHTNS
ncbi:MAG: heavy metal sensor histidine kinase [Candidatus Brocadiales bacterium]|nr:heavy metal sensor histidine kinase [Candidatus Brocadiales bacterium]